ncbi:MAG TPA: IS66 family transposase [Gemmatimonadales bacterium]|nr:IS66 family transposase [Gemmatimonadales bacterium]
MNRDDLTSLSKEQLIELVLDLSERVARLETKLGLPPKTPENSSLPPSGGRKPAAGHERKRRRKGRPGVARALDPNPTRLREIRAACCPHCRGDLAAAAQAPCESYDHVEIPPIRPEVTRVTLMGGCCPHCAKAFKAAPPADMPSGSPFGENLRAMALHLRFSQNIGLARLEGLFRDVFRVAISQGGLVNLIRAAAAPFAAQAARLRDRLLTSPVLASDETGLRVAGKNAWLWVVHHADTAVFRSAPSRGKRVLEDFLGAHRPAFWISDRYGGQKGFSTRGHQFCLAHLIRDAQYAIDAGDTGFAPGLLALLRRACRVGATRARFSDRQLAAYLRKFVKKLSELLQRPPTHAAGVKLQRAIAKGRRNLFLFVTNRALEPTNNGSERALRPCATFRKVTGGFRTSGGAAFYADIRSLLETARRRGIPPLQALALTIKGCPLPLQAA